MSDPRRPAVRRLPQRASLAQLRKQAKELLRAYQSGDPDVRQRFRQHITRPSVARSQQVLLADAQFVLAREYGFETWAALVQHVTSLSPFVRELDSLVTAVAAAYMSGDVQQLREVGWRHGVGFYWSRDAEEMQRQLPRWFASASRDAALAIADAREIVARTYDADSWEELVADLAQPVIADAGPLRKQEGAPAITRTETSFYRYVEHEDAIQVRRPLSDAQWEAVFDVMKDRRITGIAPGPITDAMMARLAALEHVTRVHLGASPWITDDGVLQLARMPQLRELELGGVRSPLTDRALAVLPHLVELRSFSAGWSPHFTDAGVANLAFCEHLERVNLMGTATGDGAIQALAGKRNLRHLKTGRLVSDAGIPLLHDIPHFKTWDGVVGEFDLMSFDSGGTDLMLDGPVSARGFARIAGLDGLYGLSFFWHTTGMTGDALAPLHTLANLAFLGCQGALCDDAAMRHIAVIPRLRMLMGQGTVATDDGFKVLSHSPSIEYLWGRECPNLTGRGFAALADMRALKGVAVSCKRVDDAALATLPRFPALNALMPMDVPDEGFRHVGQCLGLERLWCMYCRDTGDRATEHLASLPSLRSYYAGDTRITDRSLEILARLSSLERLEFWHCTAITNAGVAALASLPRLRALSLDGLPQVTRDVVGRFRADVRVTYST